MKPLPAPEQARWLLSFDFDGTLHHPGDAPPVPLAFFERIRQLRKSHSVIWGINTGRSLEHLIEGIEESRFPFQPDFAVACEREIYHADGLGGWRVHEEWNRRCYEEIEVLFHRAAAPLARIRHIVEEQTGARWIELPGEPACLIARTEEEMAWIVSQAEPLVAEEPLLGWQRNTIYLRFGHRAYQKGSCMLEVARMAGLAAEQCFAAGDGHNDLEMLEASAARLAACPANAVPEVRELVARRGGHVARRAHGHGVVEALDACFGGTDA